MHICKKYDIWFIDDIVYRGTEFKEVNSTVPAISLKITDKVITMIGMSKAYGVPNMRVGMLIAPEDIIYSAKDDIFNNLNSTPDLNLYLIGKIFETGNSGYYELYLKDLNSYYIKNNEVLNFIINGKFDNMYRNLYPNVYKELDELKGLLPKINGVKTIGQPEAGFFKVLDFSSLLGKTYKDITINDSYDFAKITLKYFNVKVLSSYGMLWPDDILAIRFSLAEDINTTIEGLRRISKIIDEAK